MDNLIDIKNLTKKYKMGQVEVDALNGINLKVSKGELIAIMGPSGSGKSTLMNILGCLDVPTSGKYILDGVDISKLNDNQLAEIRNSKVGFVFQTFNLLSRTNILGNVELPLVYSNSKNGSSRKLLIDEIIDSVGLKEWQKHRPNELSGGQKQRVAIARALINDPSFILADEPTGNLDSKTGEEIMAVLQNLHKKGKTLLIVTHELDIAKHAQKIIHLRDGRITEEEIVKNPIDAASRINEQKAMDGNKNTVKGYA